MISFMFSLFGCFNVLDHFGGVPDPNASHPKKTHVFSLSKVVRVHVCSGLHLSVVWPITGHWSSQFSCQKPTAAICPSFSFKDGCVPAGQCISRLISRNVHEQARDKRRESNVLWPNKIQMKTRKKKEQNPWEQTVDGVTFEWKWHQVFFFHEISNEMRRLVTWKVPFVCRCGDTFASIVSLKMLKRMTENILFQLATDDGGFLKISARLLRHLISYISPPLPRIPFRETEASWQWNLLVN